MTASHLNSTQTHFDLAAETYDRVFTDTVIGRAEREAVWQELGRVFHPGEWILELNCGTGVDAVHLAEKGVRVFACDIAPRMIEVARRRLNSARLRELIEFRVLATEEIFRLRDTGPFDGAFSNFAGLNCVDDLPTVAGDLAALLRPGASVLLCMSGRFVPFEIAWHLVHGHPRKALRRFQRQGTAAPQTEDAMIKVRYPSVRTIARAFAPGFRLRHWKGVGVTLPPAFLEQWARRLPSLIRWLAIVDRTVGPVPGLRSMAGHAVLEFERLPF